MKMGERFGETITPGRRCEAVQDVGQRKAGTISMTSRRREIEEEKKEVYCRRSGKKTMPSTTKIFMSLKRRGVVNKLNN